MTWSDGYSRKIFWDETESAAAGGRYQDPGQRQWEPGVGQGPEEASSHP